MRENEREFMNFLQITNFVHTEPLSQPRPSLSLSLLAWRLDAAAVERRKRRAKRLKASRAVTAEAIGKCALDRGGGVSLHGLRDLAPSPGRRHEAISRRSEYPGRSAPSIIQEICGVPERPWPRALMCHHRTRTPRFAVSAKQQASVCGAFPWALEGFVPRLPVTEGRECERLTTGFGDRRGYAPCGDMGACAARRHF